MKTFDFYLIKQPHPLNPAKENIEKLIVETFKGIADNIPTKIKLMDGVYSASALCTLIRKTLNALPLQSFFPRKRLGETLKGLRFSIEMGDGLILATLHKNKQKLGLYIADNPNIIVFEKDILSEDTYAIIRDCMRIGLTHGQVIAILSYCYQYLCEKSNTDSLAHVFTFCGFLEIAQSLPLDSKDEDWGHGLGERIHGIIISPEERERVISDLGRNLGYRLGTQFFLKEE